MYAPVLKQRCHAAIGAGSRSPASRILAVFWLLMCVVNSALAQSKTFDGGFGDLGLPMVGGQAGLDTLGPSIRYDAEYEVEQGRLRGKLRVTASLAPGFHTYSTTQPEGGPFPTAIKIQDAHASLAGPFVPDRDPEIGKEEAAYGDLPLEEFYGSVTWTASIAFSQAVDPQALKALTVQIDALVCKDSCLPINEKVDAKFAGFYEARPLVDNVRVDKTHAVWSARIQPARLKAGDMATIELTAQNDPGYHVYEFVPNDEEINFRTLIVAKTKSGLQFGAPVAEGHLEAYPALPEVKYFGDRVTWKIPVRVPPSARTGEFPIVLLVGFTTCDEGSCDQPAGLSVEGMLSVGDDTDASASSLMLTAIDFNEVAESPLLATWIDDLGATEVAALPESTLEEQPTQALTLFHILAGLAGGFILNFMPCVLPVIGLKVMSFVNQAGNSHRRVVSLNLAYVAGILSVMLVLAVLTVAAKLLWGNAFGWGEQFTVLEFKVALACLVFAMALSFLGVWEIPIPGFATSSKSGELMQKEGHAGAFLKGVLTTILATPCSGPLLGSLFGLSLVLSPLSVVVLYLVVGLGMSLPFLVLCAWPSFIRFLPKPGAWMETLKQILAFPLLLTAVFFVASIDSGHRIATLILLIVVWFACWLVGRVPAYAERIQARITWLAGVATIVIGAYVSFTYFGPFDSDLKWVPYNESQLSQYRREGKTVMIDFTANWCLNCQINTRVAIDKERVAQLVEENKVVPMLADWTDRSDAIREKLDELQSNSIPLLVIYPPGPSSEPILLRDLLTESQVIEALERAGPSLEPSRLTSIVN